MVVVGVPSTCQDSHLAGKRGASPGSPLRVAPGVPSGSGWGPRGLYKAMMRSTYIRLGRSVVHLEHRIIEFDCTTMGPRWKLLLVQEWRQPTHCGYGVGGLLKNHHTDHRAAGCVCRVCVYVREEKWAIVYRVVDKKESKTECAIILCTHSLEIKVRERNVLSGSRAHSAFNQKRQSWLI